MGVYCSALPIAVHSQSHSGHFSKNKFETKEYKTLVIAYIHRVPKKWYTKLISIT